MKVLRFTTGDLSGTWRELDVEACLRATEGREIDLDHPEEVSRRHST